MVILEGYLCFCKLSLPTCLVQPATQVILLLTANRGRAVLSSLVRSYAFAITTDLIFLTTIECPRGHPYYVGEVSLIGSNNEVVCRCSSNYLLFVTVWTANGRKNV